MKRVLTIVACCVIGLSGSAGVLAVPRSGIEVVVRERGGGALAGEVVSIVRGQDRPFARMRHIDRTKTDEAGRAEFTGLPPGHYTVQVARPSKSYLVPPEQNPYTPPLRVTILPDDETPRRVELELWRGVAVVSEIRVSDGQHARFAVLYRHHQTGQVLRVSPLGNRPLIERRLVPGDWTLEVEPLPGYLLTAVEHNGSELDSHRVALDVTGDAGGHLVSWSYVAPAWLEGTVDVEGGRASVEVVATLIEPGPWIDAARRLGGSRFERVAARTHRLSGLYRMVLPDGRWRVAPVSEALHESKPEERLLALAPGDLEQADFRVRLKTRESASGEPLTITVVRPDFGPAQGARAEVYAGDEAAETPAAGPLAAGSTEYGSVTLPGPEPGRYRLLAAHHDFLEGEAALEIHENEPRRGSVQLRAGAEIQLQAEDGDRGLPGVEMTLVRLGEEPPMKVADPEIRAAKLRRTIVTDHSGRASMRGFYPGGYRLEARFLGTEGLSDRVELAVAEGDFVETLELELAAAETVRVRARRAAASSFSLTLVCDDGRPPPPAVSVRVVPLDGAAGFAGEDGAARLDQALPSELPLARDDLPLVGHNVLRAGPLRPGVYHLALRPAGFARWSWAFDTTDPAAAAELQTLAAGAPTDLGAFPLECAPAIDLEPVVVTGDPLPDLRAAAVEARVLDAAGEKELVRPRIVREADRVSLRLLPAGRWRLVFSLEHPHFLPTAELAFEAVLEMSRGAFQIGAPRIEGIGGALRVHGPCALVRVTGPALEAPRELPCADGAATLVPSLVPGTYRVELCADTACDPPLARWDAVRVSRGETVELRR